MVPTSKNGTWDPPHLKYYHDDKYSGPKALRFRGNSPCFLLLSLFLSLFFSSSSSFIICIFPSLFRSPLRVKGPFLELGRGFFGASPGLRFNRSRKRCRFALLSGPTTAPKRPCFYFFFSRHTFNYNQKHFIASKAKKLSLKVPNFLSIKMF